MHPRKLASTPASTSGKERPRRRSSTSTSASIVALTTTPAATTPSSTSPTHQNEPPSPMSWHAGISAMTLSTAASFVASASSTTGSGSSTDFSSTAQQVSTSTSSGGRFQPHPTLPDRRQRPQSIPISFLINPVPQSPRPFTFSSPAPSSPSPPPLEASSVTTTQPVDYSSTWPQQTIFQCRSASPTLPSATTPSHQHVSTATTITTSRSLSERRSFSTSTLSQLNTQPGNPLSPPAANQSIHPEFDAGQHPIVFSVNPSTPTPRGPLTGRLDGPTTSTRIAFNSLASIDSVRPESSIRNSAIIDSNNSSIRSRSRVSNNDGIKSRQQQAAASSGEPSFRQVSLRRTTNPDLKTTKTGKILHKPKKAGVNRKNTAYNRFLKQQSKYFAKNHPQLTPQQRMKLIAEEWAVSEKNAHTTRRRSRFPIPDGVGRHQQSPDVPLQSSSSSSSSALPATAMATSKVSMPSSSASIVSHTVPGSSSSDTTNTPNAPSSSSTSSSSSAITSMSRSSSRSAISTPYNPFFTNPLREAGPLRHDDPASLSRAVTTPRLADASSSAVTQLRTRPSECVPPSSSSVFIPQDRLDEGEHEE